MNSMTALEPVAGPVPRVKSPDSRTAVDALEGLDLVSFSSMPPERALALVHRIVNELLGDNQPEPVEVWPRTAEDLAGAIFAGITGGIFGAYVSANPDLMEEELDRFVSDVRRGIEDGVRQARGVLDTLGALPGSIDGTIDEGIGLLHEKLDVFFEDVRESLFGDDQE